MFRFLVWGFVVAIGIGAGFATPLVLSGGNQTKTTPVGQNGVEKLDFPEPDDESAFIDFGELVVNFNDPRISRYIKLQFSLQVAKNHELKIKEFLDSKKQILTDWVIGHVADKQLEDIRGKQGHNRLRREIHDRFNHVLFSDGIKRIQDVLFTEFNVQ